MGLFHRYAPFFILLLLACARPPADETYVVRDEKLLQQFDVLQKRWKEKRVTQVDYVAGLRVLERQETVLFQEVHQHHFTNLTAANRFYRWRMKFPSPIAEAQRRLIHPDQ